jgi:hypothetical protein
VNSTRRFASARSCRFLSDSFSMVSSRRLAFRLKAAIASRLAHGSSASSASRFVSPRCAVSLRISCACAREISPASSASRVRTSSRESVHASPSRCCAVCVETWSEAASSVAMDRTRRSCSRLSAPGSSASTASSAASPSASVSRSASSRISRASTRAISRRPATTRSICCACQLWLARHVEFAASSSNSSSNLMAAVKQAPPTPDRPAAPPVENWRHPLPVCRAGRRVRRSSACRRRRAARASPPRRCAGPP